VYASCKDVIVTSLVIPDLVILAAYIVGFIIFRYVFPENLANLTETVCQVFFNSVHMYMYTIGVFRLHSQPWCIFSKKTSLFIEVVFIDSSHVYVCNVCMF